MTNADKKLLKRMGITVAVVSVPLHLALNHFFPPLDKAPTPVATAPVAQTPVAAPAPVVVAPKPEVVEVSKPKAAPTYEFPTVQAALNEMCEAGRDYSNMVYETSATHAQALQEIESYAFYLSINSPAKKADLVKEGRFCYLSY